MYGQSFGEVTEWPKHATQSPEAEKSPLEKMFWVYVIWSAKLRKRYIGSSSSPEERLLQHNAGMSRFTSGGVPWVLRYVERYETRTRAMQRERYLKSGAGRMFLDRVMSGQVDYPEAELPLDCLEYRSFSQ